MNQLGLFDRILAKENISIKHINTNILRALLLVLATVFEYIGNIRRVSWDAIEVRGLELYVITVPLVILIVLWID